MSGSKAQAEIERIAAEVARPLAAAVDREARFPVEAIEALRAARLLGAAIPVELGGLGASIGEVSAMCVALGRACGSTAAIFAMHQLQLAVLARHGAGAAYFRDYLRRAAEAQLLIASGTSEVGVGGDLLASVTAIEAIEARSAAVRVRKHCSVLSYGRNADALLITARRAPEAAAGDQALILLEKSNYQLEQTGSWDVLGLRGTCSPSFQVTAEAAAEQILPEAFRSIAALTMVPYAHVAWSSSWLGIAEDAVSIARALARRDARKRPGAALFGGARLAEAVKDAQMLRAIVRDAAAEYQHLSGEPGGAARLSSLDYALRINNLKLGASQLAVKICLGCLEASGLRGYANDSELSLSRQLRDALSAPLMIANDRLIATNANLLLLARDEPA